MTDHNNRNRRPALSLRLRVLFELGILATLTPLFLHYAPRDLGLYVAMALLFLHEDRFVTSGHPVARSVLTNQRLHQPVPEAPHGRRL